MNKKHLLLIFCFTLVASATTLWFLLPSQSLMESTVVYILSQSRRTGINISFDQQIPPEKSLLELKNVKIDSSRFHFSGTIDNIFFDSKLKLAWPPIQLTANLKRVRLWKTPSPDSEKEEINEAPPTEVSLKNKGLLSLSKMEVTVDNIEIPELHLKKASLKLFLEDPYFRYHQIDQLQLKHEFQIKEWFPIGHFPFPEIQAQGSLSLFRSSVATENTEIGIGPLRIQSNGKYDLASQKWSFDVELPSKEVKSAEPSELKQISPFLEKLDGVIFLKASMQGLGFDPNTINYEGKISCDHLNLKLNHPNIKGPAILNLSSIFRKSESAVSESQLNFNLSETTIQHSNKFTKPTLVPFELSLFVKGLENKYDLISGKLIFNNLKTEIQGTLLDGPKLTAQITGKVPLTSLLEWEKFWPLLPPLKTQGTVEAMFSYVGALKDWKTSDIDLSLKAKDVVFPLFSPAQSNSKFFLNGLTKITTDTRFVTHQGNLKKLSSVSFIDLEQANLKYSSLFTKPLGLPTSAYLSLTTEANQTHGFKGELNLGNIKTLISGRLLHQPKLEYRLRFSTLPYSVTVLDTLSPSLKSKNFRFSKGTLSHLLELDGGFTHIPHWKLSFHSQPLFSDTLGGELTTQGNCSNATQTVACNQTINLKKVSLEKTVGIFFPEYHQPVTGELSAQTTYAFTLNKDLDSPEAAKTNGNFTVLGLNLSNPAISTKIIDKLKLSYHFSPFLKKSSSVEIPLSTKGKFSQQDGVVFLSEVNSKNPYYEMRIPKLSWNNAKTLVASGQWIPSSKLISKPGLKLLKNSAGYPSIPFKLEGSISSPQVKIDYSVLSSNISENTKRSNTGSTHKSSSKYGQKMSALTGR